MSTGTARRSQVDVVVIGAGQAGLAVGYYLQRLHRSRSRETSAPAPSYVLLDAAADPGGSWPEMWDSLELFSPASFSSLPGRPMPPWNGSGNPPASHVIAYLSEYEKRYDLPIRRQARVTGVAADGSRFVTTTDAGQWHSRVVINATGTWGQPHWPAYPGMAEFEGRQLHTVDYQNPAQLRGARVLVVGGGNSGAQVFADLDAHARVLWATPRTPRFLPDDVDGRALFEIATRRFRALREGRSDDGGVGALGDVVMVPPVRRVRDAGRLRPTPMFERLTPTGAVWHDGRREELDAVIWCTGFRPDLRHLRHLRLSRTGGVPLTRPDLPVQSADHTGLFFVGHGDWCGPASATLIGVGMAAKAAVQQVVEVLSDSRAGPER